MVRNTIKFVCVLAKSGLSTFSNLKDEFSGDRSSMVFAYRNTRYQRQ
jgi:hypothetical protein